MGAAQQQPLDEQLIENQTFNRNLVSLKVVLFLVYGGLGCLYSTLIPHMIDIGLNYNESRIILIVVPLISLLGPLIVAPIADRLAAGKQALNGKYLRVMIAALLVLGVIVYSCLLLVPFLSRSEYRRPLVSYGCDEAGATIFQERCTEEKTCKHWTNERIGSLVLTNCSYTCQNPTQFEDMYSLWTKASLTATPTTPPASAEWSKDSVASPEDEDYEEVLNERGRRNVESVFVEPPHLCERSVNEAGVEVVHKCHVFTADTQSVSIQASLRSATNRENETHSAEWCNYPLDGFTCNIPEPQVKFMKNHRNDSDCRPMIECHVHDPYDHPGSVLAESQCIKIVGDVHVTFWSYLIIRSVADIFPAAVITLLNAAIIIATRETSTGRGDVGLQLVSASLGWAIFPLILGLLGIHGQLTIPLIVFAICWLSAAVVLLLAKQMPLSPPEWWWHTKSGMLALPLSAIRKYCPEIGGVTFVAALLGVFWSVIDSYQTWHLVGLNAENAEGVLKFVWAVAAFPSILLLWHSERVVDYCGHSNILMTAFTVYILRYLGLSLIDSPWWALFIAAMEPITLSITWVTLVLYMRHLMPRRYTVFGQALPVVAYFGVGKSIGAALGFFETATTAEQFQYLYRGMAVAALVIASLYFVLYHCVLAPRCAAQPEPRESQAELPGVNGNGQTNGNGSYSPLRVYHNGRGRKGEFRY